MQLAPFHLLRERSEQVPTTVNAQPHSLTELNSSQFQRTSKLNHKKPHSAQKSNQNSLRHTESLPPQNQHSLLQHSRQNTFLGRAAAANDVYRFSSGFGFMQLNVNRTMLGAQIKRQKWRADFPSGTRAQLRVHSRLINLLAGR